MMAGNGAAGITERHTGSEKSVLGGLFVSKSLMELRGGFFVYG